MADVSFDEIDDDAENTFKILLATDIHLGYNEKHPIRDKDSFNSFNEVLKLAVTEDVDFVLLGGDLFHDSKPSPYCIQRCSEIIRRHCFGDKPVNIEFLSDQSYHFKHLRNPVVNYEDPNINISIPIFSIHGNHDDPTGAKSVSAMDLLSTNGLINYFGRWLDLTYVEVNPILLRKGNTKLALYGLSHIHDQRLARLFKNEKVTMVKCDSDDWFNLLVLHQNRACRGPKNFIPDTSIPDFMHLAMWGHEHNCLINPTRATGNTVYITQPGSTVATSLSEGEAGKKCAGVLYVRGTSFHLKPIELQTVRPFIFKEITLEETEALRDQEIFEFQKHSLKVVNEEIESILKKVKEERKAKKLKEMLPLVRLVVKYHDEQQIFNSIRASQAYVDRVANPEDVILMKPVIKRNPRKAHRFLKNDTDFDEDEEVDPISTIGDLIHVELEKSKKKEHIKVLSVNGLSEAVTRYIVNDDADAIGDIIKYQIDNTINKLMKRDVNLKKLNEEIDAVYKTRLADEGNELSEINSMFNSKSRSYKRVDVTDEDVSMIDDDVELATNKPARGRGSRGGKGSRGPRKTRATRAK